ncbi:jg15088, partial [Pararge aegeria aegeria]
NLTSKIISPFFADFDS